MIVINSFDSILIFVEDSIRLHQLLAFSLIIDFLDIIKLNIQILLSNRTSNN